MRHGTKLARGFVVGQLVYVTSRKLGLDRMPGVVTGDSPDHVRVRVYPVGTTMTYSVWAKPRDLTPRKS